MTADRLSAALHADAALNVAGGLVLVAAGGWFATHLGLDAGWLLRLAGALLVIYGIENHLVARRPTPAKLIVLAAVDVGFVLAVVILALTDPTAAATWVRAGLAGVGIASLTFGGIKIAGRRVAEGVVTSTSETPETTRSSHSGPVREQP